MINSRIKTARQARGLTLAEVGRALGVTRQYVYAWEAGRRNPGPKHLAKLAEVLGLDVRDLLQNKEITMPRETPFQRASTSDLQPSIRRMGRPLRSAPIVSQRTEAAHSRSSIRRWMLTNMEDYRDRRTGELNLTDMVEAWDRACADGGATLDPDHIAWDVAASLE